MVQVTSAFVAIGRFAHTESLNLGQLGIQLDSKTGKILGYRSNFGRCLDGHQIYALADVLYVIFHFVSALTKLSTNVYFFCIQGVRDLASVMASNLNLVQYLFGDKIGISLTLKIVPPVVYTPIEYGRSNDERCERVFACSTSSPVVIRFSGLQEPSKTHL
jgi:hypothetical protein